MTPLIRPIAALWLVLLITSSSSRSQDRSQTLPMAATAPEGTVVSISSSAAKTGNSNQLPATQPATSISVSVDVLSNRHVLSSYVYGGAYPNNAAAITDSGTTVVRWGGNATSRYNWQAGTYNAANDWYFGDYGYTEIGDSSSTNSLQTSKQREAIR